MLVTPLPMITATAEVENEKVLVCTAFSCISAVCSTGPSARGNLMRWWLKWDDMDTKADFLILW